ncbi:LAS seventeen-binding protein 1 [Golovinomyces cichoracearum]|uniref:LAS seventeen-binding protein 1 n=1 Tax=Golovinomyces cichoracearum TaxID=62708 RepID=A0A420J2M6_9PEZI|nr:LAS seventeen-binding protein 1 [Golovinomyces cichoracearum]
MSASTPSSERQRIINTNRSLRTIKNELENLAEQEAISDEVFDSIMSLLPSESPLNGNSARNKVAQTSHKSSETERKASSSAESPSQSMNNLSLNNEPQTVPAPVPVTIPTRPEIARAKALYRYAETGDCNFEAGDHISVYEYMNPDWWLGKNLRTGQEGVFPQNYVQILPYPAQGEYGNEKKGNMYQSGSFPPPYQQQAVSTLPPPSAPVNPYNSSVPPMQVAEQKTDSMAGKGGEMGKKIGKKLGNAAIFGAGATIGGNIVNSIF